MRVLGLDLGTKRVGVAVSDPGGVVATPYSVLARATRRAVDHRAVADLVLTSARHNLDSCASRSSVPEPSGASS